MTTKAPFTQECVTLDFFSLMVIEKAEADVLGNELAKIDPWKRYNYPAEKLTGFLSWNDPTTYQFAIKVRQEVAGTVAIRSPWLNGPYIQLLGILPEFQNKGIGSKILEWVENQSNSYRNLWVISSEFNQDAIKFYQRHGFANCAMMDELVKDGMNEILLRKRL